MSRFLRRIFSDKHLNFGRDPSTQEDDGDLQSSRRVITKNPTAGGRTETSFRARLSQLNLALHSDEDARARDAGRASFTGSDMRAARPILAPSIASHERLPRKTKAPRRRLSKRHRMPDLRA
ncbi:hypothetical protein B5807_10093 [Epicoccum nigrum]|uniref:Uncharacterized protein n=1 Tax=Epicoccum nigrum TaxID=105696 RepID=A0A1Y2LTE8_EPING|nr:hypothetical protein B5807_10093 [Epicoccum nigrum]